MEAIIRHSGRQFRVKEGLTIEVDSQDLKPGSTVEFTEVLYLAAGEGAPRLGRPLVAGAKVVGKVVGAKLGPKLIASQFRRRKNSRRRIGHRQPFTTVRIESINA